MKTSGKYLLYEKINVSIVTELDQIISALANEGHVMAVSLRKQSRHYQHR